MVFLAFADIQLLPDGTLFIHIAMILGMIWILNRTFFRPINRVIQAREKNKGGHSSEAEAVMAQVNEKQERYNREMLETRTAGYGIIENEKSAAMSIREGEINAVKEETAQKLASEKTEMERQTAEARTAIASDAAAMADTISARILKG